MCEWKSRFLVKGQYRCKVAPEPESRYCVFHKPDEKDLEEFRKKFYEQIDEIGPEDERNPRYDFTGCVFPEELTVGKTEWRAGNRSVVLPMEIPPGARFDEAVFERDANFGEVIFKGNVGFSGATFRKEAFFGRATFERDADFRWTAFNGVAILFSAMFRKRAFFGDSTFEKDAEFGEVSFKGNVDFSGATFRTTISFEGSQAATVELGVHRPTILWWEKDREGVTMKDWSSGRSFWGFARRTFQKMDERERADAAYYFEKLWQWRSRLSHTARISTRILATLGYPFDLILLRIPTAYGTSIIRPLMSWFVVITLFGGLYAGFPSLLGRTVKSIWTLSNWVISLHFSVTTFTTLGLGDIYPGRLLGRALTSIEAMVGAVLMALTVVVISRKLMR